MFTKATIKDIDELVSLFWNNIEAAPEYISHGEMQMGVAAAPGVLASNGLEVWKEYIKHKIEGEYGSDDSRQEEQERRYPSAVFVYRENDSIVAFCVLEITNDGGNPFGTICDMLVVGQMRGGGIGKKMLVKAKEWFAEHGVVDIYLESGINNHSAHEFFKKQGFKEISHIFKLM